MADLEESIRLARQAVNATSNHFDRAGRLHNLGRARSTRYWTGAMADFEEAIQIARQTVDMIPKDNQNWAMYLSNLRAQFSDKYSRTGEVADLEQSIQLKRLVIDETPKDHLDQARLLCNLGNTLQVRYSRERWPTSKKPFKSQGK